MKKNFYRDKKNKHRLYADAYACFKNIILNFNYP